MHRWKLHRWKKSRCRWMHDVSPGFLKFSSNHARHILPRSSLNPTVSYPYVIFEIPLAFYSTFHCSWDQKMRWFCEFGPVRFRGAQKSLRNVLWIALGFVTSFTIKGLLLNGSARWLTLKDGEVCRFKHGLQFTMSGGAKIRCSTTPWVKCVP